MRLPQEEKQSGKIEGLYKQANEADPKLVDPYVGLIKPAKKDLKRLKG